jgi:hypothetical protein
MFNRNNLIFFQIPIQLFFVKKIEFGQNIEKKYTFP